MKNRFEATFEGGPNHGMREIFEMALTHRTQLNYYKTVSNGTADKLLGSYRVVSLVGDAIVFRWKRAKS